MDGVFLFGVQIQVRGQQGAPALDTAVPIFRPYAVDDSLQVVLLLPSLFIRKEGELRVGGAAYIGGCYYVW